MVSPLATIDDVRNEMPVDPDPDVIDFHLGEAAFENDRVNGADSMDDAVRKRIEQKLAALKILEGPAREESQKSLGSGSKSYRGEAITRLRRELRSLDPSGGGLLPEDKPTANFEVF